MSVMSAAISSREPRFETTQPSASSAPALSRYRVKLRGRVGGSTMVSVYLVIASTPYEAYFTALRSEPGLSRRSMMLAECDFVERVLGPQHRVGVDTQLARFSVPPLATS